MALVKKRSIGDALDAYLDASKQGTRVLSVLERRMLASAPKPSGRSHRVLHPSEVAADDWCPRFNQLLIEGKIEPEPEVLRLRTRSIFAYGHLAHAKWQQWFAEAGMLWGLWDHREATAGAWGLKPETPEEGWEYREVPLQSGIWEGHADGVLVMPDGNLMLEIKTVGTGTIRYGSDIDVSDGLEKAFAKISQPFPSHMRQIQIYLELFQRESVVDPAYKRLGPLDEAVFLYENKANQETKEFIVQRDDSWIADRLESAAVLAAHVGSGDLIPCPHDGRCKCRKY